MQLRLEGVGYQVGREAWLHPMNFAPQSNGITVLLGATRAGKTSLIRIMAGLDAPSQGTVWVGERNVTGMPVRQRDVAMVYQQFINYPSLKVRDNIASPLRLRGRTDVEAQVMGIASKLHIEPFLDRYPRELSGGQQQRVALARTLAKEASLILLDEPLANLDYKLREELREELTQMFSTHTATVIYATTEPGEALLLGGHTAVLDAGELLQYGPTIEVFHHPQSLRVAQAFNDPPMNLIDSQRVEGGVCLGNKLTIALPLPSSSGTRLTVGVRAAALRVHALPGDIAITAVVQLAELSGSDTFIHMQSPLGPLVMQLTEVHDLEIGTTITAYLQTNDMFVFAEDGRLLRAARRGK